MQTLARDDNELFRRLCDPATGDGVDELYPLFRDRPGLAVVAGRDLVAARHADVTGVLRSHVFGKPHIPPQPTRALRAVFRMFLMLDPPDHTRLRRAVAPFFTPAAVADLDARIDQTAAELVNAAGSKMEVVTELAYPLPLRIISSLLGVGPGDAEELTAWTRTLTSTLDSPLPLRTRDLVPLARAIASRRMRPIAALHAVNGIVGYARDRVRTSNAPIPAVLRRAVDDGALDQDEAAATWVLLFIAGHETTANLIANCLHALAAHPQEAAKLRSRPELIDSAIEETLRFDTPVPLAARQAGQATTIGTTTVRKGTLVYLLLAAANRDPAVFDEPDAFIVDRPTPPPHLGFGHGLHFCLGAFLARREVRSAVRTVLAATPDLQISEPPSRRLTYAVRGFDSLHLRLPTKDTRSTPA